MAPRFMGSWQERVLHHGGGQGARGVTNIPAPRPGGPTLASPHWPSLIWGIQSHLCKVKVGFTHILHSVMSMRLKFSGATSSTIPCNYNHRLKTTLISVSILPGEAYCHWSCPKHSSRLNESQLSALLLFFVLWSLQELVYREKRVWLVNPKTSLRTF